MILELLFLLIVLIQLFFYFLFGSFTCSKFQKHTPQDIPISVIICAKNEAHNLADFLPSILHQIYTNFEIVLVNDHSTDKTLELMLSFKGKYNSIKVVNLVNEDSTGNKKHAITQGIKAATYEHLLFTDADCKPNSEYWIKEMSAFFSNDKSIILGYGAYQKKNTWLNKLIRFETLLTAIQYFSYAKIGLPYMGVGRNLAYTKSQFYAANGFANHKHIKSGDDDLFINQVATKKNTAICFSSKSFTVSKPNTTFKKWMHQKRRHITTATSYKPIHQFLLGLFYSSQLLFWCFAILLSFTSKNWQFIVLLFSIRIIVQYLIFGFTAKKLNEKDLFSYIPFMELFLIIIQMYLFIFNLFHKPKTW